MHFPVFLQGELSQETKTPQFTVKFDIKLGGKDRTWYNLTDQTYFGYNLT